MKRWICLALALVLCLSLAACKDKKTKTVTGESAVHTVLVLGENDAPLANVGVFVYEDQTQKELVWYDTTDENGKMTFEDVQSNAYVAVLSDVPVGYAVEESYALTGLETTIRLKPGVMTDDMDITYNLGDMVMDFTVTDTEGNAWSLKEQLQTHKAVVLNFYYNGCVPCQMEFPLLQEAYLDYMDQIALIAMNPVDGNDAVAAFKEEYGLLFPMAAVNPKWEQFMQISAYPKTVVIDRFGNIVLMHTGSIDSAQTFRDVFAAVSAEEYEQVIYNSIADVPVSAQKGTKENPDFMGPTQKFEVTVGAGQEYYIEFLKVNNLTLRIADPNAYVIYNNKTYQPENGVVSLILNCPDMYTSIMVAIGNSAEQEKTFTVTMASQPGTINNPYSLVEGDNKVRINAGNEQGVYYQWTAKENGSLKVWCTSATAGIKYDCVLYNLNSYAQRSLANEGQDGELGQRYVEVLVNKGDKVQMIAAVLPDENWNYPAGNFIYMAEFLPGPGRDKDKVEMTTYTITVTDEKEQPLANVNFQTVVEETATNVATNAEGIAQIELPTGEYKFTMIIPEGYTSEITEFTLNKENPEYTMVLTEKVVVMVDYTVMVTDTNGNPIAGANVILGDLFNTTDAEGKAVFTLEQGEYAAQIITPEGFVPCEELIPMPEGETAVTVELSYIPGTVNAPIVIEDLSYTTEPIAAGEGVYYALYRRNGMILTITDTQLKLTIGEEVYTPGEDGLQLVVPDAASIYEPVVLYLENTGDQANSFVLELSYPLGHVMNPEILEQLGQLQTKVAAGNVDGYYYSWTATEEGVVTFYVTSGNAGYDISLTNNTNAANRTLLADGQGGLVSLNVYPNDTVTIQMISTEGKALELISVGSFTAQENTDDTKLTYSVMVRDEHGEPMADISVIIGTAELTTDANGLAFVQLAAGDYSAQITVPEGYKTEASQLTLTIGETQANVVLTKLKKLDYEVCVTYNGYEYMDAVTVQFWQNDALVYEEDAFLGMVMPSLTEGEYTVKLILADKTMAYDQTAAKVTADKTSLTIPLEKLTTETDYTVTVRDAQDNVVSGVLVQILEGSKTVATGTTNASGVFAKKLVTGNYTVKLTFSGTKYYYSQNTAVLTGVAPNLTIRLANEVDSKNTETHWLINDRKMYVLQTGTTHVQIGTGKAYTHTGSDYTDCLFAFAPEQLGVYSIAVDQPGLVIREYGPWVGNVISESTDQEDGTLHWEIKEETQLGNVYLMFGIQNKTGVTDVCVTITRIGEPGFSMENLPVHTDWYSGYVPTMQAKPTGTLKYLDIKSVSGTYEVFFDETDGVYKVMVNGVAKTLYMNLGTVSKQNISLAEIIATSTGLRKYVKDSNGNIIYKEEYTDLVTQYISNADSTYGVYAMTKDLAYIIQNAKPGWWDASSPDYLLEGCNPEYGWLFAACYF